MLLSRFENICRCEPGLTGFVSTYSVKIVISFKDNWPGANCAFLFNKIPAPLCSKLIFFATHSYWIFK